MKRKKPFDIVAAQKAANDYARGVLNAIPFGLSELDQDDFQTAMGIIHQQLVAAWAAGFSAGRDS